MSRLYSDFNSLRNPHLARFPVAEIMDKIGETEASKHTSKYTFYIIALSIVLLIMGLYYEYF